MVNKKTPKVYKCESCDFVCGKQSDYDRHMTTRKHFRSMHGNKKNAVDTQKHPEVFECSCGNVYKHLSGLSRHKKNCRYVEEDKEEEQEKKEEDKEENKQPISTDMFFQLMKQNQDLQNLLIEQQKQQTEQHLEQQKQYIEKDKQNQELQKTVQELIPKIGNTINGNVTNNTFNVQVFLNEQCKDALNLTDFLRSLQIGMDDLMKIGELGYSDGLSRIMVNGLKNLSITERPIHCTDAKREIIYVKDDNIWEKEKEGNPKLQKSIKYLANKNEYIMKTEWADKHPHWEEDDTNDNREYHRLAMNMLGGTDDQETLNKKISKQILPEVKLDKTKILGV